MFIQLLSLLVLWTCWKEQALVKQTPHMSSTPHLSRMDILGVRSCPIDRWRKTYKLQILQAAFALIICVLDNPPHTCCLVLKRSKKGLHFTQYFSISPLDTTWLPECPSESMECIVQPSKCSEKCPKNLKVNTNSSWTPYFYTLLGRIY